MVSKLISIAKYGKQRFNREGRNNLEVKEQYQVKVLNMFAALGKLDDDVDINTTC
jgi:hypothetical protein